MTFAVRLLPPLLPKEPSIGEDDLIPEYAATTARPVFATFVPSGSWNVNVYEAGSEPVACFRNVQRLDEGRARLGADQRPACGRGDDEGRGRALSEADERDELIAGEHARRCGRCDRVAVVVAAAVPIERKAGSIT